MAWNTVMKFHIIFFLHKSIDFGSNITQLRAKIPE